MNGARWKKAVLVAALAAPLAAVGRAEAVAAPIRMYIYAGQSNMVGYSAESAKLATVDPTLAAPVPTVKFWGPVEDYAGRWTTLQAPTEIVQPADHNGFGPELSGAASLAKRHPGASIAVVKLARNGSNIGFDWRPGNVIGLYPQLIQRVMLAKRTLESQSHTSVEIAGFFWMQGESETLTARGAATYARDLASFITSVRADLAAPDMPFVIGRVPRLDRIASAFRYTNTVRAAQQDVAATVPGTRLVSTDGLEFDSASPFHFDTRGIVDLGRRFAAVGV